MKRVTLDKQNSAKNIKLVIFDVDGVLTSGVLSYGPEGEEVKHFNVKDGLGIKILRQNKVEVAIITARDSQALARRVKDLNIQYYYSNVSNKLDIYTDLLKHLELTSDEVAYVGDDVIDLPVMYEVGLSFAVSDAHVLVLEDADLVTTKAGGEGVVREVVDFILACRMPLREAYRKSYNLKN